VRGRVRAVARAVAPAAVAVCVAVVLLRFPPEQYGFYPKCPIYEMFHVECPGRGTMRALAALLHGHVAEAFRLNALTMSALPVVIGYAAAWYRRYLRREAFRWPQVPAAGVYAVLTVAVVFAVFRNLPGSWI